MRVAYSSSADLARSIGADWVARNRVAYTWPYNRFKWEESETWWIVPAPDRQAFLYSKIIVSSSRRLSQEGQLFVGLYVEKGVGRDLAAAGYYPEEWVLGPTWRWHGIINDLTSGRLTRAIADAAVHLGQPIEIKLDAHVPTHKGAIRPPHDLLTFRSTDGVEITLAGRPIFATQERFLESTSGAQTLIELASGLRTIPRSETVWVNLHFGRTFERSGLHDTSALSAQQLVDLLLEPFASWVV
ncbi:MAG: hypothetical protein H6Q41_3808 [Deltaproteobacteria bacterium]|jgi:hypothetical protein|nr:hypothetical protein [Deltaproteobacteria bacterium]